jgi:hypothetical protein
MKILRVDPKKNHFLSEFNFLLMSRLSRPSKGIIFSSILFKKDTVDKAQIISIWEKKWGPSIVFFHPFSPMKKYYSKEMGLEEELERYFLLSLKPIQRVTLIKGKLWAVEQEKNFLFNFKEASQKRGVNWDIGILSMENVLLATGKNFTHRVYIGKGIFADLTLFFKKDSFQKLEWTYPDYGHTEIIEFFNWGRKLLIGILEKNPGQSNILSS